VGVHVELMVVLVVEQYLLVQQDQQLLEDRVIHLLQIRLKVIQVELTLKHHLILVGFQDQVVVELELLDQQLLLLVLASAGGAGGSGVANNILGPCTTYAGGGGGGGACVGGPPTGPGAGGAGGSGGGGTGASSGPGQNAGSAGGTNLGGGGGGAGKCNTPGGQAGGPGIVVVRAPSSITFAVTPCTNTLSTHPGGDKIAKFTVSGTLTVS
jgi:hypothetical protein